MRPVDHEPPAPAAAFSDHVTDPLHDVRGDELALSAATRADRLALEALDVEIGTIPRIDPGLAATPAALHTQRRDLSTWVDPA